MKKLVIFDLDGTLLNTIADLAHSTNYALNKLGYPTHEIEKYNFMVGNGIDKLFERALPEGEKSKENALILTGCRYSNCCGFQQISGSHPKVD